MTKDPKWNFDSPEPSWPKVVFYTSVLWLGFVVFLQIEHGRELGNVRVEGVAEGVKVGRLEVEGRARTNLGRCLVEERKMLKGKTAATNDESHP